MNILKLIASDSFITVNKEVIKKVGLVEAVILGELASEFDYWTKNNGITEDGYFFSTIENIEDKTTLSEHQQRKALNTLKENGIIDIKVKGLPAKRYIKINESAILALFEDNAKEEVPQEEPIEEVEEAPKKASGRKSRKDQLTEFVNEKSGFKAETKEILLKWIFQVGIKGGVTVQQLQDMLRDIWTKTDGNEHLVREAISQAYLRNWFGFYYNQPKPGYKVSVGRTTQLIPQEQYKDRKVELSTEVF